MSREKLNALISVSQKNIDMAKGKMQIDEIYPINLGLISLKWLNDSAVRFGWTVPKDAKWEKLRLHHDNILLSLQQAGFSIENANEKLKGIFSRYAFERALKVNPSLCWEMYNNIDRLNFKYENTEKDVTGPFVKDYIYRMNSVMNKSGDNATPDGVGELLVRISDIKDNTEVCDSTTGTSTLLVKAKEHNSTVKVFGQDINEKEVILSKIKLLLHGITNWELETGDIFKEPKFVEGQSLKKFDYIISNLPFMPMKWGIEEAKKDKYGRFVYGLTPTMSGEWAFIQHDIASLKDEGKAVVVTTRGSLAKEADQPIREALVKADIIDAIIDLPERLFENSGVSAAVIVFNKNKPKSRVNKIQFIDASGLYEKEKRQNFITEEQVSRIVRVYAEDNDIDSFSKLADIEEIERNDYRLSSILYLTVNNLGEELTNAVELRNVTKLVFRGVQVTAQDIEELQKQPEKGYRLVNIGDIQNDEIITENLTEIALKSPRWESLYTLKPGDILISARGALIKTAVVSEGMPPMIVGGNLVCIRVDQNKINPYYLKIFLDSPVGTALLEGIQTGSVIKVINSKNIESIVVPLLPYEIQKSIAVDYVNGVDKCNKSIQSAQQELQECVSNVYGRMGLKSAIDKVRK